MEYSVKLMPLLVNLMLGCGGSSAQH